MSKASYLTTIRGIEVLDSRGNPTIEVEVYLHGGAHGRAAVPSGASTGIHEAVERRDRDPGRYAGKGVRQCIWDIEAILAPALRGIDVLDQVSLDCQLIALDGTANKQRLGANTILAVSLAAARAAAAVQNKTLFEHLASENTKYRLPVPLMNLINGGAHATGGLPIQEIMVIPHGFFRFSDALRAGVEIYQIVRQLIKKKGYPTTVGDEGGFAPPFSQPEQAFALLLDAIQEAGYLPGQQVSLALDVAASEFYQEKEERYDFCGRGYRSDEMVALYRAWSRAFPICSIEDGLAQDDWDGWALLTRELGSEMQLVGDDLFVTHPQRLKMGIEQGIANAILIKPNQVGTLSETLDVMKQAEAAGYARVVSHRSGETEDALIADLAVACNAGQIKTGAPCRGERTAKYNQLLRIEQSLGVRAYFVGNIRGCVGWERA